jgi:hypothetical protein
MMAAMPNKLFEYMSQGVVPLILNAAEAGKFCRENGGIGVEVESLDDLHEILLAGRVARERILATREEMVMENHIQPLIDLYEEIS